jgi:hypothetical protein
MSKTAAHYVQRFRELGPLGTHRRVRERTMNRLGVWSQSLWWGWKAHREMSDAAFLARTTGGWRSMDALLDHLAGRPASSFFLPHESPQVTSPILNHNYPEHVSAVLAAADAVCRNEVSLLGRVFHYANGIDWHIDPVAGWRSPLWHISRMGQYIGSPARPADLILIWELNRHQHFITLGIAYWLTGDQRYVDAFSSQVRSWIETNPVQHGVNWCYGLEVSIRLLAWTVAFQFFRSSQEFRENTGKAFLKSLWQQADFLSGHLQTTRTNVPNNHMMAELTGLALVGAAFPEFRRAAVWRKTGLQLLNQQATAQTYPDGVNKEQATGYHRFVAELLLLIVARGRQGALSQEPVLEKTLELMLDYMFFSLTPDGTSPLWGDSDYGRALGLGQNKDFWDFRPILSAGAALFSRSDWKYAAGRFDEEAFWLLGTDGLDLWEHLDVRPPEQTSRAFPHAGLYIIRDSWAADTDVAYFRCGPFGLGGERHCAHSHCDLLSFVLWVSGQPLLVDSGTYTYHGPWRDPFRLTAAHNAVLVDGCEQAIPMPYFSWRQVPEAKEIDWTGKRVVGALTNPDRVEFVRELAHPRPGVWELVDKFIGPDEHRLEWFFHFAPGLNVQLDEGEHTFTVFKEGCPFLIGHMPDAGIRSQLRETWFSYQYGVKQSNLGLHAQWQGELEGNDKSFHWQFQLVNARPLPKE